MRILISTWGSRGDVQPVAALALALRARGVEVRLSAPADAEFAHLLDRVDVPWVPAFCGVHDWIETAKRSGTKLPELSALMVTGQYEALTAAAQDCDAIVATGIFPSLAAARMVAEKLGVYFVSAHFCPRYLPSPHHPPVEFPGWPHPKDMTDNRALWQFNIQAMDGIFGAAVNAQRVRVGLPARENLRDHVFAHRSLLAVDPVLGPWVATELCDAVETGAWILPDERPLARELEAFLRGGPAPVYVGFGSMAMKAAPDAAGAAIEAVRAQGRRVLVARGWAGLAAIDSGGDCLVIDEVNQQALFPRVAAVIHHGGAGTTLTAARAGVPQLIVPQIADQPYWAARIADLGIGAAHDGPVPTVESLSAGLETALAPQVRERAAAIATTIRTDGAAIAADMILSRARLGGR